MTDKNRQFNLGSDMPIYKSYLRNESSPMGASCNIPLEKLELSCVDKLPLAMAYVPMQEFVGLYDSETGFDKGTIFSGLDFPFTAY